jgi:hypothetical protein
MTEMNNAPTMATASRHALKVLVDTLLPSWQKKTVDDSGQLKDRNPLDLAYPEKFLIFSEELLRNSEQYGGPVLSQSPRAEVFVLVGMALASDDQLWDRSQEDGFNQAYEEILRFVLGLDLPHPENHAFEVALLWAYGALPRANFSWNFKGWDGCPEMARSILLNYLNKTIEVVISWLTSSHASGGPRVPQLAHNPREMAVGLAMRIRDYLVLWPAGYCPCCRDAAAKKGISLLGFGSDDPRIRDFTDNESTKIKNCLRRHRLVGFLKHLDEVRRSLLTVDDLKTPKGFIRRLYDTSDLAHDFRSGLFSKNTQQLLRGTGPKEPLTPEVLAALVEELNQIIQNHDLVNSPHFAELLKGIPSEVTENLTGVSRIRRNRLLLEGAFAKEIVKSPMLSLGQFLQEAVRNAYGVVQAGALNSGMLYPLLQECLSSKGCQLDHVSVAVRRCACRFLFSEDQIRNDHIINLPLFVEKLRPPHTGDKSAISKYLFAQFNHGTKKLVSNFILGADAELARALPGELNNIIRNKALHKAPCFAKVLASSAKAKQWAAQDPGGARLVRLNRLLLELSFPQEFSKADGALVSSYTLNTCPRCNHAFQLADTIFAELFHIDTSPTGGFLCKPSWTCECGNVYLARTCLGPRGPAHKNGQSVHDQCPKCGIIHPMGKHWNRCDVYWWVN